MSENYYIHTQETDGFIAGVKECAYLLYSTLLNLNLNVKHCNDNIIFCNIKVRIDKQFSSI